MTTTDTHEITAAAAGGDSTAEQLAEVLAWFDRYDERVAAGDLNGMADLAAFPINEVTDDADGYGIASACDRERYLAQMREVVGANSAELTMHSTRHPIFLSPALCFVVTDASFELGGRTQQMRYGDLLVRTAEGWRFQTMVAGGWHEQM
ncbi:hypothetical protein [Agromyces mediolanus]|uniref:hypothetical protein n=1 Tax=Agromyces mediolanus TaxID=41986 RepID=UPI001E50C0AC|nr:hypothetical protein [Agromyces mediolanus]MCD1570577.1 hypothetical protein [Agromyces mediolanus]